MKKILVTGCLGYIGTEICELLSGLSWKYDIHGIDNKFFSSRVSRLRIKNIKYDQIDILDKIKIQKFLKKNFDIIIHLAGITDVAYTKFEANSLQDNLIKKTAITGTNNILKNLNKNTQILFPSTHVIFNGLTKIKKNIDENFKPNPILSYAYSKFKNEEQIKKSGLKYVIFRLGSAYGASEDSTRVKIMPNYFSYLASQNKDITVFGNGSQLKSLVSVKDIARAFLFFIDWKENEIFNLVNEQLNVKQVANIVKKFSTNKIKINFTKNHIPNKGYSLSNEKIKKTGFKFLYNINYSIKDMLELWSEQNLNKSIEYKQQGLDNYIDQRGIISNYKLNEGINLIGYIESKKNSIRANHYHPVQEQKCLLIKGKYISIIKDLTDKQSLKITKVVNAGDIIVTRPNVAHTMVFLEDSIFLNLVRGEREHKNYGITHTIPSKIINEKEAQYLSNNYNYQCIVCGNYNLLRLINLGYQPLANDYRVNQNKNEKFPLELNFCENCFNGQLSFNVKKELLFKKYNYQSSTAKPLVDHFDKFAKYLSKKFLKKNKIKIIEVGSNDGIFLKKLKIFGFKNLLGIEPAVNFCNKKYYENIKVINDFCVNRVLKNIGSKADVVFAANVFAHTDNITEMAKTMIKMLKPKGTIIIEVQYLISTLKDKTFDNIYHEHYNYWTVKSLSLFFQKLNAEVFKVEKISTHGGSIRVFVKKNKIKNFNRTINFFIKREEKIIKKKNFLINFEEDVVFKKKNFIKKINFLRQKYKKIVGFGAPAKATTLLNYFNYNEIFDYFVEDNELKIKKFIPGTKIIIKKASELKKEKGICVVVFAWNYYNSIKKREELKNLQTINLTSIFKKNYSLKI